MTKLAPRIDVHGDDVAARHLAGLARRGRDPRPAFQKIIEDLRAAEAGWFRSEGEGHWPALDRRTVAQKAREHAPAETLVRSGALLRSLTAKRGAQGRRTATAKQMRFGTRVFYATFHAKGQGVPQRSPLVPTDRRVRRGMVDEVRHYLMGRGTSEELS